MIKWKKGCPPTDGKQYLLNYYNEIFVTGKYRYGELGEPQQDEIGWRCDCCGRFGTPIAYAEINEIKQDVL